MIRYGQDGRGVHYWASGQRGRPLTLRPCPPMDPQPTQAGLCAKNKLKAELINSRLVSAKLSQHRSVRSSDLVAGPLVVQILEEALEVHSCFSLSTVIQPRFNTCWSY